MYYNRTVDTEFSALLEQGGNLRWLYEYVKGKDCLDFLIGKSEKNQWISVYRGLSRVLTIKPTRDKTIIKIEAAESYKNIVPDIYGKKSLSFNFEKELDQLIALVENNSKFDRYYNCKKEGYYQNELSRKYGICGLPSDDFIIIDKEAVVGYDDINEKNTIYGNIRSEYKQLQTEISKLNPKRYGSKLSEKSIGNELDFLALDKDGNILLIEYKDKSSTSGIYLSPLQIGMYFDLFAQLDKKYLESSIAAMLEQKKKIGVINHEWKVPPIKEIVPVLIISNYNYNSSAKQKYGEILDFVRSKKGNSFLKDIRTYNYTSSSGLIPW